MHSVPPNKDPITEPWAWNAVAAGYDEVFFAQLSGLTSAAIELLRPEREDTMLDVATGPGTLAIRLAPLVRKVVAVDFAEVMIQRLRGHIMRSHVPNIEALVMNGEDLVFEACSFDAAVSLFGVFLFDDRQRGLSEMFRVVAPGGRALFSSWAPLDENTVIGVGMNAIRTALPDLPRPKGPLPTQQPEVCVRELEAVGFEQVITHRFKQSVAFSSVSEYWQAFERGSAPLGLLRARLGDDAYAEAAARAQDVLLATCGAGAFNLDCSAILTYGERARSAA